MCSSCWALEMNDEMKWLYSTWCFSANLFFQLTQNCCRFLCGWDSMKFFDDGPKRSTKSALFGNVLTNCILNRLCCKQKPWNFILIDIWKLELLWWNAWQNFGTKEPQLYYKSPWKKWTVDDVPSDTNKAYLIYSAAFQWPQERHNLVSFPKGLNSKPNKSFLSVTLSH